MTWYAWGSGHRKQAADEEWWHGSHQMEPFDRFDFDKTKKGYTYGARHWNSYLGSHFTSEHETAARLAFDHSGTVYHVGLAMKHPKHYYSEKDMDREAHQWATDQGHNLYRGQSDVESQLRHHPAIKEIAHGFREHLKSQGHDGITYGNEYEGSHLHECAIAFHPDDITIKSFHHSAEECKDGRVCATCQYPHPEHAAEGYPCDHCGDDIDTGESPYPEEHTALFRHFAMGSGHTAEYHPSGVWEPDYKSPETQHAEALHAHLSEHHPHLLDLPEKIRDLHHRLEHTESLRGGPGQVGQPSLLAPDHEHDDLTDPSVPKAQRLRSAGAKEAAHEGVTWYHGSPRREPIESFESGHDKGWIEHAKDFNTRLGTHFTTEKEVAENFAGKVQHHDRGDDDYDGPIDWDKVGEPGHVYHAHLDLQHPKHYPDEWDLDKEAHEWGHEHGFPGLADEEAQKHGWELREGPNPMMDLRHHPQAEEIARGFKQHLVDQGHDSITYGNHYEGTPGHLCAIAFHPGQVTVHHKEPMSNVEHPDYRPPKTGAKEDDDLDFRDAMEQFMDLLASDPSNPPGTVKMLTDPESRGRLMNAIDAKVPRHAPGTFERHVDDQLKGKEGAKDIDDLMDLIGGNRPPRGEPTEEERAQQEAAHQQRVREHQEWQAQRPGVNPGDDLSHGMEGYPHAEWVPIQVAQRFRDHSGDQNPGSEQIVQDITGQLKSGRGMTDPLMLHHHNEAHRAHLGEGNHRLVAAERAGWTHVPMRVVRMYDGEAERGQGQVIPRSWRGSHQGRTPEMCKPSDVFGGTVTKETGAKEARHGTAQDRLEGHSRGGPGLDQPGGVRPDAGALPRTRRRLRRQAAGAQPRDVTWHPKARKDLKALDKPVQVQILQALEGLAIDDPVVLAQTHPMTAGSPLKGWYATKASRGHRIIHQPRDGGIHVGAISLHEYGDAIRRLTVKEPEDCRGTHHLPRAMSRLEDGTLEGMCISCMQFHPVYEVVPPSKPEWPKEFRLAPHAPSDQQHTAKTRSTDNSDGVMVALVPPPSVAKHLAQDDGTEAVDSLHITLAYLGDKTEYTRAQLRDLPEVVEAWAETEKHLQATTQGAGTFTKAEEDGEHVMWAGVAIPGVNLMHERLVNLLVKHGYAPRTDHEFTPHITLTYSKYHVRFLPKVERKSWEVDEAWVCIGGEWQSYPLEG